MEDLKNSSVLVVKNTETETYQRFKQLQKILRNTLSNYFQSQECVKTQRKI